MIQHCRTLIEESLYTYTLHTSPHFINLLYVYIYNLPLFWFVSLFVLSQFIFAVVVTVALLLLLFNFLLSTFLVIYAKKGSFSSFSTSHILRFCPKLY